MLQGKRLLKATIPPAIETQCDMAETKRQPRSTSPAGTSLATSVSPVPAAARCSRSSMYLLHST